MPLALLIFMLGWIDLPPRPAGLTALQIRIMSREELLARRRDGRSSRRRRRQYRELRERDREAA